MYPLHPASSLYDLPPAELQAELKAKTAIATKVEPFYTDDLEDGPGLPYLAYVEPQDRSAGQFSALGVSRAQAAKITEAVASLTRTGHTATVSRSANEWDRQDGVWVLGDKPAALGRCAFVTDAGETEWRF